MREPVNICEDTKKHVPSSVAEAQVVLSNLLELQIEQVMFEMKMLEAFKPALNSIICTPAGFDTFPQEQASGESSLMEPPSWVTRPQAVGLQ